jgi:hypothetical protein
MLWREKSTIQRKLEDLLSFAQLDKNALINNRSKLVL